MSKSLGNQIPLMSTPEDMFGKVMSIPDKAMLIYHKLVLGWAPDRLRELEQGLANGSIHPNNAKMSLAGEIVSIFHSPAAAQGAQKLWDESHRGMGSGVPEDIPESVLIATEKVIDILRRLDMVASGAEAQRLMGQNGIRLNDQPVTDIAAVVSPDILPAVLQVGKRKFVLLVKE